MKIIQRIVLSLNFHVVSLTLNKDKNIVISNNKLWELLIDRKMSAAELRKTADITLNTLTRMKGDREMTMQVLERICEVLHVDFGEVVEYIFYEDREK